MSEVLTRRSALASVYQPGQYGSGEPTVRVMERRGLEIVQVAAFSGTIVHVAGVIAGTLGIGPATVTCQGTSQGDNAVLWVGPDRWWLVRPGDGELLDNLATQLGDEAALTPQGHGRVALRLWGHGVRDLLASGTTVDVHPSQFSAGWCRPTQLAHMGVVLHCVDDTPTVDVYVPRSYAVSFWEWLLEIGAGLGLEVLPTGSS